MSLIFDSFPSKKHARRFAATTKAVTDLEWHVFDTEKDAQQHDPIPASLVPPVVHIERPSIDAVSGTRTEREIIKAVRGWGGRFVGT